jgi:hypothetical protein
MEVPGWSSLLGDPLDNYIPLPIFCVISGLFMVKGVMRGKHFTGWARCLSFPSRAQRKASTDLSRAVKMVKIDVQRDYYADLGLKVGAIPDDIKKQFKKLGEYRVFSSSGVFIFIFMILIIE